MKLGLLFCTTVAAIAFANVAAADPSPPLSDPPTGAGTQTDGGGPDVGLAVQPSMLAAHHFGPWFLSADARVYALPDPATLALFAGGGAAF